MKKFLSTALLLVLLLAFTACSRDDVSPTLDIDGVKNKTTLSDNDNTSERSDEDKQQEQNTTQSRKPVTTQAKVEKTSVANDGSVTIKWNAVLGAISYDIYRATSTDGEYTKVGTTTTTSFTDKNAKEGTKYVYKIIATKPAPTTKATTTKSSSPTFVGSTLSFINKDQKTTKMSSISNDYYISKIKSEYAKAGMTMPSGRLVHVTVEGIAFEYVFQFESSSLWNDTTLSQVQIFKNENEYFSFFTQNEGPSAYIAAKKEAENQWNKTNEISYADQQKIFLELAKDPNFKTLRDKSFK